MRDLTGTSWLRRGSSILFGDAWPSCVAEAVSSGAAVPLRALLAWAGGRGGVFGGSGLILAAGLEAVLDTAPDVPVAEAFLAERMRPLILAAQGDPVLGGRGLIFLFSSGATAFPCGADGEETLFRRGDGGLVRLGFGLWGGAAGDMARIMADFGDGPREAGRHVARLS